ncbi:MAG: D-2-hydroxyacid dehydrogenase [Clostridiaceae bacterium]
MKIVDLDGFALNPGDISFDAFKSLGEFICYDRTNEDKVVERSKDAEVLLINKIVMNREVIDKLPKLKYIGVLATGFDNVDINYAKEKGIVVTNIPGYSTEAVAQMTFSFILELSNQVALHDASVKALDWSRSEDFCYWKTPIMELSGKTIGLFGFGEIGKQVAKIARAFNMKILVHSRTKKVTECDDFITWVDREELFKYSDFLSLHCPLNQESKGIINKETLSTMKKSAFLINTARGKLVNEYDLAEALNNNLIAGAALDVLCEEPPREDNPLLTAKNVIITPHIAWAAKEARERLVNIAYENIKGFIDNKAINVVNK